MIRHTIKEITLKLNIHYLVKDAQHQGKNIFLLTFNSPKSPTGKRTKTVNIQNPNHDTVKSLSRGQADLSHL